MYLFKQTFLVENKDVSEILTNYRTQFSLKYYPEQKTKICEEILMKLNNNQNIEITKEHYETYLEICLENEIKLDALEFISNIKCKPDNNIYKLLIDILALHGETETISVLLNKMKSEGFTADARIFNALVLAHSIRE